MSPAGFEPGPPDVESSALTMRQSRLTATAGLLYRLSLGSSSNLPLPKSIWIEYYTSLLFHPLYKSILTRALESHRPILLAGVLPGLFSVSVVLNSLQVLRLFSHLVGMLVNCGPSNLCLCFKTSPRAKPYFQEHVKEFDLYENKPVGKHISPGPHYSRQG